MNDEPTRESVLAQYALEAYDHFMCEIFTDYRAEDMADEIVTLRARLAATEEQLRLANIDAITAITEDA